MKTILFPLVLCALVAPVFAQSSLDKKPRSAGSLRSDSISPFGRKSTPTPTPVAMQLPAGAAHLAARVVQVLPEGLLVSLEGEEGWPKPAYPYLTAAGEVKIPFEKLASPVGDIALIKGHPKQKETVDGEWFRIVGWPDGIFKYTDTTGAARTVRVYRVTETKR